MIQFNFGGTNKGVETDKGVQLAIASFENKLANYNGIWNIDAGYEDTHKAYCKITGTGLNHPVLVAGARKVDVAVRQALKEAHKFVDNKKQTAKDKKEHANKKLKNTVVEETVEEDESFNV